MLLITYTDGSTLKGYEINVCGTNEIIVDDIYRVNLLDVDRIEIVDDAEE